MLDICRVPTCHLSHLQANFRQIASPLILGFHMYKIWIKTILIGLLWELSELIHAEVMLSGQRM